MEMSRGRDTARDHGWLLLAATASVLIVIALVAAQLTFTSGTTGRTDTAAFLDEAGGTQGRFVVSVALFTSLAFLVVPVFLGLRRVLADDREIAMDLALGFAILGAAFSGVADATQLALGAGTVPLWHGADAEFRTALLADAQSQLWSATSSRSCPASPSVSPSRRPAPACSPLLSDSGGWRGVWGWSRRPARSSAHWPWPWRRWR